MAKNNLRQTAYEAIKEGIMNCTYEPGAFLCEEMLCMELNMSRTPIRDALSRLEQEKLLNILPKKGFMIAPVTIRSVGMVFETRILLEPYIVRNYCHDMPKELLERMRKCLVCEQEKIENNLKEAYRWDHQFHMCMLNQCSNEYMRKLLDDVHGHNSRLRVISGRNSSDRMQETVDEHKKILFFLGHKDFDSGAEAMREHLIHARESALNAFVHSTIQNEYVNIAL